MGFFAFLIIIAVAVGLYYAWKIADSLNKDSSTSTTPTPSSGAHITAKAPAEKPHIDPLTREALVYEGYEKIAAAKEEKMVELAVKCTKSNPPLDQKIEHLTELINTFYALKTECASHGTAYAKEFAAMWERDPPYIVKYENLLSNLKANYDQLKGNEEFMNAALEGLEGKVIAIIEQKPGIKQIDLYKDFDSRLKSSISEFLYRYSKSDKLVRIKEGNTYRLYQKNATP
ncbi:MAG: hypothetical protein VB099_16520 [Candidatus Limiplasma sp.]|nr:hypothetical protein [Candidatus Limiplasma sp.]